MQDTYLNRDHTLRSKAITQRLHATWGNQTFQEMQVNVRTHEAHHPSTSSKEKDEELTEDEEADDAVTEDATEDAFNLTIKQQRQTVNPATWKGNVLSAHQVKMQAPVRGSDDVQDPVDMDTDSMVRSRILVALFSNVACIHV